MVFHESLNPERKFSLAIPLVFIAILGGTTGVVSVATVLSSDASYAVNARSQLAQGAAPAGSDKSECTADSPTGQIDPATKKVKKVGKKCKPAATKGEKNVTVDDGCEANDNVNAGKCLVTYCSPGGVCAEIQQESEPKNIPQSTKQLLQMVENVQTAPEGGAEFVGLEYTEDGTLFSFTKNLSDERMSELERAFSNDFDASIPAPNKGGISALDEIKGFAGESATPIPGDYQGENPQAIDEMLKNNATYLGPTSPGLSESDLLRTPLSELNGDYKYGDMIISTDGKGYTVFGKGQFAGFWNDVRDGQTVGDVVARKQYVNGPESPYQYGRDTFAANVEAQGEVSYSSAQADSGTEDRLAFDKWAAGLPGAAMKDPAYDFRSGALEPGLPTGKWEPPEQQRLEPLFTAETQPDSWRTVEAKDFNYETAGSAPQISSSDILNRPLADIPYGETRVGDNVTISRDGDMISVRDTGVNPNFTAPLDISKSRWTVGDVLGDYQERSGPLSSVSQTYDENIRFLGETSYSVGASDYAVSGNWAYGPGDAEAYSVENVQKQLDATQAKLDGASAQMPKEEFKALTAERDQLQGMIDQSKPYIAAENFEKEFCQNSVEPGCNGVPREAVQTRSLGSGDTAAAPDANVDWTQYDQGDMGAMGKYLNPQKPGEQIPLPRPVVRDLSGSLDVDVSKLPQGVDMKIGDGILVTNDGKKIEVKDVASGKTETYAIGESKGAKLADLVQDAQVSNSPFAQEADNLRKAADSVAKTDPERAAGLRREADKIDPRIPTSGPAQKAPVDPNGNPSGPGKTGAGDSTKNNSGSGSGIGSALSSMLQGLMKALGTPPSPPAAPAQACATDQNAYAQQQQQYQQQLQQYNYQLQQQQYQQQMNQYYASQNGGIAPPSQPAPVQPTPCVPSTGSQCRAQPQQPPASACSAGSWRATYSGACVTGWQCISTQGPKAELVCEPEVADVGSTLAITYGCSSGVASSSSFQVTTQPGGSATTTVKAPPAGTNTATYTLACTEGGKTTGAQCSVKVNRPTIILVANPKTVPSGEISLLSWLTTGMDSCIISSPDQPDFTARNSSNTSVTGAATSSPIASSTAMFQLDCITKGGMDRQATTSVSVSP